MITNLFSDLTHALEGSFQLAIGAAFLWGILSILLSPCHLSSIPLVIGYMNHQTNPVNPKDAFSMTSVFALGILLTIAVVGIITASLGRLIGDIGFTGNMIMGIVFIVIGLYLMDIVKLDWSVIPISKVRITGARGAFLLGLLFGIGIGPCTFAYVAPVLGIVFQTSHKSILQANSLLVAFGVGHIGVIVVAGTLSRWVQNYLNWSNNSLVILYVKRVCGFLVVAGGTYLIFQAV
jgi:cytochrome c-type biogenesis protein